MTDYIYIPTPISEPPKEDGWYTVVDPIGGLNETFFYYLMEGEWYESEDEARLNEDHESYDVDDCLWLRPVPRSEYDREVAGRAFDAGYARGTECFCGKCEYCKANKMKAPDKQTYLNNL